MIMGRKTHESILRALGYPLPGRRSIVLTRAGGTTLRESGVLICSTLDLALTLARSAGEKKVFYIGGASVYREALERDLVDRLLVTRVQAEFQADTFFPEVVWSDWSLVGRTVPPENETNPVPMIFEDHVRKQQPKVA